jgi:hypothetical protein
MDPECPAPPALNARSESPTGSASHTPEPEASLTHLVAALVQQTQAINRLAASNEGMTKAIGLLIDEMGKADAEEQGDQPGGYLNARGPG